MAALMPLGSDQTPVYETAQAYNLELAVVGKMMELGLPLQMQLIADTPIVARKMYMASLQMRLGEVEAFYSQLGQDATLAAISVDEYVQMFGPPSTTINETVAAEVGATPEQVSAVMGGFLPALKMRIKEGIEADQVDEAAFPEWAMRQAEAMRNVLQ